METSFRVAAAMKARAPLSPEEQKTIIQEARGAGKPTDEDPSERDFGTVFPGARFLSGFPSPACFSFLFSLFPCPRPPLFLLFVSFIFSLLLNNLIVIGIAARLSAASRDPVSSIHDCWSCRRRRHRVRFMRARTLDISAREVSLIFYLFDGSTLIYKQKIFILRWLFLLER